MADKIIAAGIETDGRTWPSYAERVVATVTVDAILEKVFQGQRPDLREQMLNVAMKATRCIEWSPSPEDIAAAKQKAALEETRRIAERRRQHERDVEVRDGVDEVHG